MNDCRKNVLGTQQDSCINELIVAAATVQAPRKLNPDGDPILEREEGWESHP